MDVAKLDVVDAAENPLRALAAETELADERAVSNGGALALDTSRLMGRFSFYTLRISRRLFTFQQQWR